ncbi:CDP-glucose 4,6-dehydratase [Prosthecomicrobium sp. N25]|uniref:CDP-glucose 4,6-dehydratase n=1 Tax=Prosthecomicrobium sp. N25 TaxID=3129254 RepID=UPI003077002A
MARITTEAGLERVFRGKRVLLTGHTGFKGGWMALWLRRLGAEVTGIALPPPTDPSFCKAVRLEELVDSRIGDIRSEQDFARAVGGQDFDVVIHMAAQALVRASYTAPVDTYLTNVVGTAVVLEQARRMPSLKACVVVTSDKCYENREWVWGYRENDPMGGKDFYSSSKGCTELVAAAYRSAHFSRDDGPQMAMVRAGNVIGGGDWAADRIVPDLVRSVETGEPTRIRSPRSVRPWQHVLEPVRGYLTVAANMIENGAPYAGGWNFGPDRHGTVDVGTLADMIVARWEGGPRYVVEPRAGDPHEARILRLDITKAEVDLGWQPLLDIGETVGMTVDWYRNYHGNPDGIRAFSEAQLGRYAALWERAG